MLLPCGVRVYSYQAFVSNHFIVCRMDSEPLDHASSVDGDSPSDASSVDGDDGVDKSQNSAPAHKKRCRKLATEGALVLYLFVVSRAGCFYKADFDRVAAPTATVYSFEEGGHYLVGVGLGSWFHHSKNVDEADDRDSWHMLRGFASRHVGTVNSYLSYYLIEFAKVSEMQCFDNMFPHHIRNAARESSFASVGVEPQVWKSLDDTVSAWKSEHGIASVCQYEIVQVHAKLFDGLSSCGWDIFHSVAIPDSRAPRRNYILGNRPTSAHIRKLAAAQSHRVGEKPSTDTPIQPLGKGRPIDEILEWLDVSMDLKQIRRAKVLKGKFAKIFARATNSNAGDLDVATRALPYETLRRARARLDCTMMLAFRVVWASIPWDSVDVHIFTDASPQWKGTELFASTFDLIFNVGGDLIVQRRFFHLFL